MPIMPIIGVKRSRSSQLEHQTPNKKPTPTPGLWSRFVDLISSVMSRDDTACGNHASNTAIPRPCNTPVNVPQTCVLHTPVLSELEKSSNRKYDILSVNTPSLRPSRTPLFTPVLLSSKSRQLKIPRSHKTAIMSSNSSSLPVDVLSVSHPSMISTSPSQHYQEMISRPESVARVISSRPISAESRVASRLTSTRTESRVTSRSISRESFRPISIESRVPSRPASVESSVASKLILTESRVSSSSMPTESKDKLILTSKSEISLPVRQLWNTSLLTSTSQWSASEELTSHYSSSSNIQSTLMTSLSATQQHQSSAEKTNCNGLVYHHGNKSRSGDQSGKWQKWLSEFKESYHSNRKDLTAQIEAAEKYAKLQNNQRHQLCNQRVDQLRRRFDSGLNLDELLETAEEQAVEMRLHHDEEEEQQIQRALSYGSPDEELSHAFRIRLKRRDISTLNHLNWLNDEVVNFYMNMIAENCPDVHSYSSFFYPKLMSAGYSGVRRWTKKVDVFNKRLLLIPVHLGMHWCLAAVDFTKKQISYYDSMMGHNQSCLDGLRQYLTQESQDKKNVSFDLSGWKLECPRDIPVQLNSSDCGVFMCMYARHLAGKKPFSFSQDDMPAIRRHIILEILEKKLM